MTASTDDYHPETHTFRCTLVLPADLGDLLAQVGSYTGLKPSAVISYLLYTSDLASICAGISDLQAQGMFIPPVKLRRKPKAASEDAARVMQILPRKAIEIPLGQKSDVYQGGNYV